MLSRRMMHQGIAIIALTAAIQLVVVAAFSMHRSSYTHHQPSILSSSSALSSSSLFVAKDSGTSTDLFIKRRRNPQRILQWCYRISRTGVRKNRFLAQSNNQNQLFLSMTTNDWNDDSSGNNDSTYSASEGSNSSSLAVSELLNWINDANAGKDESEEKIKLEKIKLLISDMESSYASSHLVGDDKDLTRFDPLLGLYDVSQTITAKPKQNPVGGKWTKSNGLAQKILKTRRTFQHLLPFNSTGLSKRTMAKMNTSDSDNTILTPSAVAEAVNVISLEAFWSLVRLTVILRGDAVPLTSTQRDDNIEKYNIPLSNLAVKVIFDPPRIVFGKRGKIVNLNVGPTSSVTLDTTYCDKNVRIGKGGTSGTKFVFARCGSVKKEGASVGQGEGDEEENEWRALLAQRPMKKSRILSILSGCFATGLYGASSGTREIIKVAGYVLSVFAGLVGLAVAFSSGGIEKDDPSYTSTSQEK